MSEAMTPVGLVDELHDVRTLLEAIHMAAGSLDDESAGPLRAVIDIVQEKLAAATKQVATLLDVDTGVADV